MLTNFYTYANVQTPNDAKQQPWPSYQAPLGKARSGYQPLHIKLTASKAGFLELFSVVLFSPSALKHHPWHKHLLSPHFLLLSLQSWQFEEVESQVHHKHNFPHTQPVPSHHNEQKGEKKCGPHSHQANPTLRSYSHLWNCWNRCLLLFCFCLSCRGERRHPARLFPLLTQTLFSCKAFCSKPSCFLTVVIQATTQIIIFTLSFPCYQFLQLSSEPDLETDRGDVF